MTATYDEYDDSDKDSGKPWEFLQQQDFGAWAEIEQEWYQKQSKKKAKILDSNGIICPGKDLEGCIYYLGDNGLVDYFGSEPGDNHIRQEASPRLKRVLSEKGFRGEKLEELARSAIERIRRIKFPKQVRDYDELQRWACYLLQYLKLADAEKYRTAVSEGANPEKVRRLMKEEMVEHLKLHVMECSSCLREYDRILIMEAKQELSEGLSVETAREMYSSENGDAKVKYLLDELKRDADEKRLGIFMN